LAGVAVHDPASQHWPGEHDAIWFGKQSTAHDAPEHVTLP